MSSAFLSQVEFQRVVGTYKGALQKLEELSLSSGKKDANSTLRGPAPVQASHQRQLSLKQPEIQERLIKNKTLLNVVEPTLGNHSLDILLGESRFFNYFWIGPLFYSFFYFFPRQHSLYVNNSPIFLKCINICLPCTRQSQRIRPRPEQRKLNFYQEQDKHFNYCVTKVGLCTCQ